MSAARKRSLTTLIVAIIMGISAFLFGVQSRTGQWAEAAALEATTLNYSPGFPLSLVSPSFILVVVGSVALLAAIRWGIARAVVIAVASFIALLLSQILKRNVLERPSLWELDVPNTFPSGHTTVFAVIAFALIAAAPPAIRGFMSVISFALLALTSWQVLDAGWHRPSDVFGATMLAIACYALLLFVAPPKKSSGSVLQAFLSGLLGAITALCFLVGIVAAIYALISSDYNAAFLSGAALCFAAAAYGCRAVARITRA